MEKRAKKTQKPYDLKVEVERNSSPKWYGVKKKTGDRKIKKELHLTFTAESVSEHVENFDFAQSFFAGNPEHADIDFDKAFEIGRATRQKILKNSLKKRARN